jgi:hypothetical protein
LEEEQVDVVVAIGLNTLGLASTRVAGLMRAQKFFGGIEIN